MSDPDILYIAKPYKLDLVDLFSGAIRTQKWTLYLKTPPHYKLKHLYSTLPVQIHTPAGLTFPNPRYERQFPHGGILKL